MRKWQRHSQYELANGRVCWEHCRMSTWKVKVTSRCRTQEQEQRCKLWPKSNTVIVLGWIVPARRDTNGEPGQWGWPIALNCSIQLFRDHYQSPLLESMLQCQLGTSLMRLGSDTVNMEIVTDDWCCISARYQALSCCSETQGLSGYR